MPRFWPLVLTVCLAISHASHAQDVEVFTHLKVEISGVYVEDLRAAGERCGVANIDETHQVIELLSLPSGMVDRNAECRGTRWNVWGDQQHEYIFNFRSLNQNGGTFQTILVYTTEGERVGIYRALNVPLSIDFVERAKLPALLRLSGEGRWLGERIQWSGLFEVKNRKLMELPNDEGRYASQRCPSSNPVRLSTEAVSSIDELDLRLAICSDEKCTLGCVDTKDPAACEHRILSYFAGSFSSPKVLEVVVGVTPVRDPPGMPKHGAYLYLLQATACGWKQMGRVNDFIGEQDACDVVRANDRDFLLCQLRYGPYPDGSTSDVVAAYSVRGNALRGDVPYHAKSGTLCQPGALQQTAITEVSVGEVERKGIVPVQTTVESAVVKWSARQGTSAAEACQRAQSRVAMETRAYPIDLEFGIDGLRLTPESARKIRSKAIPGVAAGFR